MREMEGLYRAVVRGKWMLRLSGMREVLEPKWGMLAQVTPNSTSASREVTENQMKPFLSSVHGTIHLVSRVSSPWNDRLLRDQPDECWVNPTYEDWPQTKQLRSFRNTLMHFSSIFNAFVITFRPWGDRVNTVISALRQEDGLIDGRCLLILEVGRLAGPTFQHYLCACTKLSSIQRISQGIQTAFWILDESSHYVPVGPNVTCQAHFTYGGFEQLDQRQSHHHRNESPTQPWPWTCWFLAIPLLWTEGGSSKFLLRCWSSAGY